MKYSSSFAHRVLLPPSPTRLSSSPAPSPTRARRVVLLHSLGSIHAVTLACTAAFAAASTALLCTLFLSGELWSASQKLPLLEMMMIQPSSYHSHTTTPRRVDAGTASTMEEGWTKSQSLLRRRGRGGSSSRLMSTLTHHEDGTSRRMQEFPTNDDDRRPSPSWPTGVAWLMSFPNSGTSYTLHAIRELTNTTTATNYGLEGEVRDEESVPVFPGEENGLNGPYLELLPGKTTTLPKLILTKTHCGGYPTILDPEKYILSSRSFLRWCLTGKRGVYSSSSSSSSSFFSVFGATPTIESRPVQYDQNVVKRVVHLIRNPLDNIVARFHNERYKFERMQDKKWLLKHPNNKRGFRKWCISLDDDADALATSPRIDKDLADAFAGVPCRAEFFRYIQWHNHAFTVTQLELDVPSMVLHYEDYSTRYADVTQELMDFLDLKPVAVSTADVPEFIPHKVYHHYYYSDEQTRAIATLVKEFSMKTTWKYLSRYFVEDEDVLQMS